MTIPFRSTIISFILFALLFSGCDGGIQGDSGKGKLPDESSPFAIGVSQSDKGTFLTIKKDSLDKQFLMQSEMSIQRDYGDHQSNPTSYNLRSRVLTFKLDGERLVMFESGDGMHPGKELPANVVLAAFPIKEAGADRLSFDFNEGMKNFIMAWDWYGSDDYGYIVEPDRVFPIQDSYLRSTKTTPTSATITQNMSISDRSALVPMEVTYYLTQHNKNPNYKPVESPGFDYLGFFEASPITQEDFGDAYTHISRWDISKPITYYISSSTPEKYRSAAKEGVLYWNKAFGKEVLRAEVAPEGITAPDFEHNIIQWHTDIGAGFAYADAQMDPLTGEILHAQIFIPSSFAEHMRARTLPKLDRKLDIGKKQDDSDKKSLKNIFPMSKQMQETRLCSLGLSDLTRGFYKHRDLMQRLSPERVETITSDYIRMVVAHEVGHTLGLRHNFAASSTNEWSGGEERAIFKQYLTDGKLPDKAYSILDTVMEYPNLAGDLIGGALIVGEKALPYDQYAIQWGYSGFDQKPSYEGHPFCTDSSAGKFLDCVRFDAGKHILDRLSFDAMDNLKQIPKLLSEVYLSAKANMNPKARQPINSATPSAELLATSAALPLFDLWTALTQDIPALSVYVKHPEKSDVDSGAISEEMLGWLNTEISHADGIEKLLEIANPDSYEKAFKSFPDQFKQIVASGNFKEVDLYEGGTAKFTEEEIGYMKKKADELFPETRDLLALYITYIMKDAPLKAIDEVENAESVEARWAGYIITSGTGLDFQYSLTTRSTAAELLRSRGPFPDWLESYIPAIAEELRRHLEAGFGMPIDKVDISKFPRGERERIAAELDIYYSLGSSVAPEPKPEPAPID